MYKYCRSIYINGVPGTGKTATVNEIIKCLKRSVEKGKLDYFDFVEINGMKLSEPRQAYVQVLKQLSGKVLTWEQAYNMLEKRFNSNIKRPMTLLLVDEVCYIYIFIYMYNLRFYFLCIILFFYIVLSLYFIMSYLFRLFLLFLFKFL